MELQAISIRVKGADGDLLPATTFRAPSSRVTPVVGDPGYTSTALSLALAGRVKLLSGEVLLDGRSGIGLQRQSVALVDVPEVSSPEEGLPVRDVVAEELAFAGAPFPRAAATDMLESLGLQAQSRHRFETLDPSDRLRVLTRAAAERPLARILVVEHPDRRGGDPRIWWPHLHHLAAEGLTIVAQISPSTARVLGLGDVAQIGQDSMTEISA